ncbi:phospholipase D-like domain-containing protein (plasmid) [Rhizobium sp. CB3090]|uniref:phospholipase D-like domain-containing protein n=1 Tax=Rhizobium sp. CB3090 TaxID=3039156 RepID=UPI0024B16FA2|nr:phospholipase D-like domain-containing protein [Rhizobium sp. CB3090]WFU13032.1 phospholipase D-like domain-containing protein [Rhizobium sp. CB3090]
MSQKSEDTTSVTIHIVFPVLRGKRRFKIERGRRWSVIEHLLLQAVCRTSRSAAELAKESLLPRRVVVEALTRLMRAGWVEIRTDGTGVTFHATANGLVSAWKEDLPSATALEAKWRSFFIDDNSGSVFRVRDITTRRRQDLPQTTDEQYVYEIPRKGIDVEDLNEIFNAIQGQDEFIVGVYPNSSRLVQSFGLITIRNDSIEGMPRKASPAFIKLVNSAFTEARKEVEQKVGNRAALPAAPVIAEPIKTAPKTASFDQSDLIYDGKRHLEMLEATFKGARERVIVHSTFITENAGDRLKLILAAAGRGVRVDIFWGQDEQEGGKNSSQNAIEYLKKELAGTGKRDLVRIHPFTTSSHAKFLIADDRTNGWVGLLGSCNWMASSFESFDASVRLRDYGLLAELTNALSIMSHSRLGIWTDTSQDLATLSRRIAALPERGGRKARMQLLYTGDHSEIPMIASREARERIFVTSHQLGIAGKAVTIFPLLSALTEKKLSVVTYYSKTAGKLSGLDAAAITREYAQQGFNVTPISKPRIHAKVLGWDNDHLTISSFNWLSVDPNEQKPMRELGVQIESNRIAENFIRTLENAKLA